MASNLGFCLLSRISALHIVACHWESSSIQYMCMIGSWIKNMCIDTYGIFVGCRGYKVVVKFFPNEAANLEPVVDLLLTIEQQVLLMPPNTAKLLASDTCT